MYSADPTAKGQKAPVSAAGGSRPALSFSPPKTYYGLAVYTYFYTANSRKEISVMPAIINGIVYDDRNQNGQYDVGEPGIPGVFVLLYTPSGSCSATQSDSNGSYGFSVTAPGAYTVCETALPPNACPPTVVAQPAGYAHSNSPRTWTTTVTAAQIERNEVLAGQNFGHDAVDAPLPCTAQMIQFVSRPTSWYDIDLVSGQSTLHGLLSPAHDVNAIGYSPLDDSLYGYDQTTNTLVRIDGNSVITQLTRPAGLPAAGYNTGTFDAAGFFYLYINNTARFYTVDLRPSSPTFLKLVDPRAGYAEQTANYGTPLSAAVNISDWAYDPSDGTLYGVQRDGVLTRVAPTTGQVTSLSTTAPNPNASFGAVVIDSTGTLYAIANNDGTVYRYTHSGNTAAGVPFSTTFFASFNDGAICPRSVVLPTADLLVSKTAEPVPATAGQPLTYFIQNVNNGPDTARDAVLIDAVPAQLLVPEYSLNSGATWQPWTGSQPLGDIPAGASATVLLRGMVDPSATGSISNTASVSSSTYDPDLSNNTDTVDVPIGEEADLSLVKTGAPKPARPGELVTYTLAAANAGPSSAVNVVLEDPQPPLLNNLEWSLDNGSSWQPWTPSLPLGTLLPGEARVILLRGTVPASAAAVIQNTAAVTSDTPDPDPGNNTSSEAIPIEQSADLSVTKTGSPSPVSAGGVLTYTVELSNLGPSDAQNTVLSDPLPDMLSGENYSLDGVTFQPWTGILALGTFPAGSSRTVFLRGTVDPAATGTLRNTATISSDTPDPNPDNNSFTERTPVNTAADLALTKTGTPSPVLHGQLLTYTVTIRNLGPDPAVDARLDDTLPSALLGTEYSLDGGGSWAPWPGSLSLGTLATGQNLSILLRGTVHSDAEGILENTASVSSLTPDPDPDNNSDTARIPVDTAADLSLTKTALPPLVTAGELLTYTITVSNAGPSAAQDVLVRDDLPAALLGTEFSVNGGPFAPWVSPYPARTLPSGASIVLTIRGTVSPSTPAGTLTNTASASSSTPDPNPDNNTDRAVVDVAPSADLSVVKQGASSPAIPGQLFQYSIQIRNTGPSDSQEVLLSDAVPSVLLNPQFSTDNGQSWNPWSNPYSAGVVSPGQEQTLLLQGILSPSATDILRNTAVVSSSTPDPDPSNNADTDQTPVQPSADLSLVKTGSPASVSPGDLLTYTLLAVNSGPADAQNVILTDRLPAGLSNAEHSADGGLTWTPWNGALALGTLAAGLSQTHLIRAVAAPQAAGSLVNTAVISSDTPDPNPANNTDTQETPVVFSADLSVVKTGPDGPVLPGQLVTYTILIANAGPNTARDVLLSDTTPPELSGVEFSLDSGSTWIPWDGTAPLGDLSGGSSQSLLLRGELSDSAQGTLTNTAEVSSPTPDPDRTNNCSTSDLAIAEGTDLRLDKCAPQCAQPCRPLIYALTVTNLGPNEAQQIMVSDPLPPELSCPAFSLDCGKCWQPWPGYFTWASLQPGQSVSFLLSGTVRAGACSPIVNHASVTSATPELNPMDNEAQTCTQIQRPSCCSSADLPGRRHPPC